MNAKDTQLVLAKMRVLLVQQALTSGRAQSVLFLTIIKFPDAKFAETQILCPTMLLQEPVRVYYDQQTLTLLFFLGEINETTRARTRTDDEPLPKKIRLSKRKIRKRAFVFFCSDENATVDIRNDNPKATFPQMQALLKRAYEHLDTQERKFYEDQVKKVELNRTQFVEILDDYSDDSYSDGDTGNPPSQEYDLGDAFDDDDDEVAQQPTLQGNRARNKVSYVESSGSEQSIPSEEESESENDSDADFVVV